MYSSNLEGRIIKGLGGFYTVCPDENAKTGSTIVCKARGRFRKDGLVPLPGDRVRISIQSDGVGRLEEIFERRNIFVRPPMANLDALVLVASLAPPRCNTFWIDRILAVAHQKNATPILCLNKTDLEEDTGELAALYRGIGYTVVQSSALTGAGIDDLRQAIKGKLVAFSGHSGVGKSSLLNALSPELLLPVGGISQKLGRGRHTTRHVELFAIDRLPDTWIADTPGFSAFEPDQMDFVERSGLPDLFPEFSGYECRFPDCSHIGEKQCGVRDAATAGKIAPSRYDSYRLLHESIKDAKPWEKR